MSETCETVTIETKAGPVVINKSDYDPKHHVIAGQKTAPKRKAVK